MRFFKRHIESVQQADCATKVVSSLKQEEKLALDLAKPTVFYFPGNETTDGRNLDYIDVNSRIIETHLTRAAKPTDTPNAEIYSISYSENKAHAINQKEHGVLTVALKVHDKARAVFTRVPQVLAYRKNPENFVSQDAKDFVADVITPALKHGERWVSADELSHRLANLTLVGNSYGSIFATEVGRELKHQLLESKAYNPKVVHDTLKQVAHIAAPNVANILNKKDNFTGIYFEGRSDIYRDFVQDATHAHTACRFPLLQMKRDKHETSDKLHLSEPKESLQVNLIRAGVQVLFTPPRQMHTVDPAFDFVVEQEKKKHGNAYIHDNQGHAYALYTVPTFEHGGSLSKRDAGKVFGQTLRNATYRSQLNQDFIAQPELMVTTPSHRGAFRVLIGDKVDTELLATTEPAIRPTTHISQGERQGNTAHVTSAHSVAV